MKLPIQTAPVARKSLATDALNLRVGVNPSQNGMCYLHGGPGCVGTEIPMSHQTCCTTPGAGGWMAPEGDPMRAALGCVRCR